MKHSSGNCNICFCLSIRLQSVSTGTENYNRSLFSCINISKLKYFETRSISLLILATSNFLFHNSKLIPIIRCIIRAYCNLRTCHRQARASSFLLLSRWKSRFSLGLKTSFSYTFKKWAEQIVMPYSLNIKYFPSFYDFVNIILIEGQVSQKRYKIDQITV